MPLEPATRLGVYEVLGPLGAGGMGEVYRARDTRLGREVAIKVLPEGLARDETRLARFEREARLLASLNHPGIAAVYGFEEVEGIPYLVMELVPGETLTQRLTAGALSLEESLALARQIAEALEAAHEKGVIHRDLKPANIKITPEGKAKVLDLGLAKAFAVKSSSEEDLSRSPTLVLEETRPGVILGTAEFMSPEQARGKATDKRTDIWAFGCILYEMLSGRRAFTGETLSDVIAAILDREPDWTRLPRETPPRVRDLLVRSLEKDPNRRLRDIGDARIEIERCIKERESAAPAPASPSRRRSRRRAALAVLAALLAAAAFYFVARAARPGGPAIPRKKYLAVLPFRDLSGQPGGHLVGDGLVETVSVRLARVPGIQVVTPTAAVSAAEKESDPYRIARRLGANLILSGAYQRDRDQLRITYSLLNAEEERQVDGDDVTGPASDIFAIQDRLTDKVALSLELAPAPGTSASTGLEGAAQQDRYLQAIGLLQRYDKRSSVESAIRLLQALAAERPSSPLVHAALGRAYLAEYNLTDDRSYIALAEESCSRASRLEPGLAEVHVTLGALRARTGRPLDAVSEFQRVLSERPNSTEALRGLADAYERAGRLAEAEATYQRAVSLQPGYWAGYNDLGVFHYTRGNYAQARDMFRRVVELAPDHAYAYSNLGGVYEQMGAFDQALAAYERSIALQPTGAAYANAGTLYYFLGKYEAAAEASEKAVRLAPANAALWANLGDARRFAPALREKARDAYEQAIRLAEGALHDDPRNAPARRALARSYAKTGRPALARTHIERAIAVDPENPETLYQAAVVANLSGRRDEALGFLKRATERGFGRSLIARDPELANLRGEKAFREAVQGAEAPGTETR